MLKVGITGGIGSGKTTVCEVFDYLGIPVYSSDQRAKLLMNESLDLKEKIIKHFGAVYDFDGNLNRKMLATLVFGNSRKIEELNSLVHPAVFDDYANWLKTQSTDYVLKEAALMFESESYKDQDAVITVYAPKELRIQRVMQRDACRRIDVLNRMKHQLSEQERQKRADYIIKNDNKRSVIQQVIQLHQLFKTLS
jgi:dephospho-CoA kinase